MEVKELNPESTNQYCVLGVADTEKGRIIEKEMREWLLPHYHLFEVWHDGSQFEYPALKFMQDLCDKTGMPALYLHTRGAFNTHWTTPLTHKMWKEEFGDGAKEYFDQLDGFHLLPIVACPLTGSKGRTWYNGFVASAQAMREIKIVQSSDRKVYEKLFCDTVVTVIPMLVWADDKDDWDSLIYAREYLKNLK